MNGGGEGGREGGENNRNRKETGSLPDWWPQHDVGMT